MSVRRLNGDLPRTSIEQDATGRSSPRPDGVEVEERVTADGYDDWEAADWLVALTDAPDDPALRARFAEWLATDPENPRQWKATVRAYRALEPVGHVDVGNAATVVSLTVRPRRRTWIAAGLGAALAACLALVALPSMIQSLQADFISGTAEIRRVELGDGSIVQLAPQSAITVDLDSDRRRVKLLEGIAVFDVAPDPTRPFSVSAGRATATAVGTAFEVRNLDTGDSVAVRQGIVDVATGQAAVPARLAAGDAVRVSATGAVLRGTLLPDQIGLWAERLVTARERPVADLVSEIRRYYSGLIVLRGDRLAGQTVSGIFDVSHPEAALALIAATQGAALYELSPWILVLDGS